ncbi:MAG: hypothetical protein ACYC2U_05135 [Candidatus Amoebophilus sp.]
MLAYYPDKLVVGCDEIGRGCLAGPVVTAAVILPPGPCDFLLKDSKKLPAKQRIELKETSVVTQ